MLLLDTKIEDTSLREVCDMITDSFPFRTACSDIQDYPCHRFPWHWHEESEILYIIEGKLNIKLPSQSLVLNTGDVIFIPSNVLHSTYAVDDFPGVHKEYIFSPLLIGGAWSSVIMQKNVLPLINDYGDYILVPSGSKNGCELQGMLTDIQNYAKDEPENFEFYIRQSMNSVWMILMNEAKHRKLIPQTKHHNQDRLYKMLEYIQNHFAENITLNNIAAAAGISKRECNRCFKNSLHTTTMDYLLDYRINQACTKLMSSNESITEIGYSCGFYSASYFTKRFREKIGLTPKEYRKAPARNK